MKLTPRCTVKSLDVYNRARTFVVLAKIVEIVEDGPWWYSACVCGRDVGARNCDHTFHNSAQLISKCPGSLNVWRCFVTSIPLLSYCLHPIMRAPFHGKLYDPLSEDGPLRFLYG
ncbi:hypothetical protein AHAS_Ahas09G0163700 [Arachis hypogaea]